MIKLLNDSNKMYAYISKHCENSKLHKFGHACLVRASHSCNNKKYVVCDRCQKC